MITDINSEDRLVPQTFAAHLAKVLDWESVYAYKAETFGPNGTLGRTSERDAVPVRDLDPALERLNPDLPASPRQQAIERLDSSVLSEVLILVPPIGVQGYFRDHLALLHSQWDNLEQQIGKLRAARDLLLPRLMSGEIAV